MCRHIYVPTRADIWMLFGSWDVLTCVSTSKVPTPEKVATPRCRHVATPLCADTCWHLWYQSYGLYLDTGMCWQMPAPGKVPTPRKVPTCAGMCQHIKAGTGVDTLTCRHIYVPTRADITIEDEQPKDYNVCLVSLWLYLPLRCSWRTTMCYAEKNSMQPNMLIFSWSLFQNEQITSCTWLSCLYLPVSAVWSWCTFHLQSVQVASDSEIAKMNKKIIIQMIHTLKTGENIWFGNGGMGMGETETIMNTSTAHYLVVVTGTPDLTKFGYKWACKKIEFY